MDVAGSLAYVTRAKQLESLHMGSAVIARADGSMVGIVGDQGRVTFPRSAIKLIQALPIIETGVADRIDMSEAELALACASHSGSPYHVAIAQGLLKRIGLDQTTLACGGHEPLGEAERAAFIAAGQAVGALHNNCSGKHAGMLAVAVHEDGDVVDYELASHPVQRRIAATIAEVTGADLSQVIPGIDGCSVPNWPIPLENLAVGFARVVTGGGLSDQRAATCARLMNACWAEPTAMAGKGRFDTEILTRFSGDVFIKTGAEGVYCGGIRSAGIGFALKVDDGAKRGAEVATAAIIGQFVEGAQDLAAPKILHNARGIAVGDIRPGSALMSVLERARP